MRITRARPFFAPAAGLWPATQRKRGRAGAERFGWWAADREAPRKMSRLKIHLHVIARGVVFGFGVYAVIRVLVFASAYAGLLDWLHK